MVLAHSHLQFRRLLYETIGEGTHEGMKEEISSSQRSSGVNGTPTFFIDGQRHDGSYDFRSLVDAIDRALE